jgi:3-oxoadipate enol-lactonase
MSSMAKHEESRKETKAFADANSEREERFIELRGVTFHCLLEGPAGAPWMVFAHSLATDLTIWNEVAAKFVGFFRILRYDQRGHGKTSVPPGPYSFDMLADDAAALMEFFDITNAVFAGVSMGAITALLLASRHSARLRAAIVCDGQPFSPANTSEVWEQRVALVREAGMQALVESTVDRWFRPSFIAGNSARLNEVRAMIRSTPAEGYIQSTYALHRYDLREGCSRIRLPLLLLVGAQDGELPAAMQALHATIAQSKFVMIEDAGHLPNVEQANLVISAMTDFLDGLSQDKA